MVKKVENTLFFLNWSPQSQRTRKDDITPIEFRKHFHSLSRQLNPNPEIIIYIPFKHIHMIWRVRPRFGSQELIHDAFR